MHVLKIKIVIGGSRRGHGGASVKARASRLTSKASNRWKWGKEAREKRGVGGFYNLENKKKITRGKVRVY